jgi:regulator of sigma E protease
MLSNFFTDALVVIVVLGIMIFVHELGHFLAAKGFGVRVLAFSFGFGPRLFGYKRGVFSFGKLREPQEQEDVAASTSTDYRVSLLPLGGYVKMAGEDPSQARHDPGEFLVKPRWQRFLIVAMGPAMNILLAILLLTGLYKFHYQKPAYEEQEARIGYVEPDSPAAKAGLKAGDVIVRLAGKANPTWEDADLKILTSVGESLPLVVLHDGEQREAAVVPKAVTADQVGYVGWAPAVPATVSDVEAGYPAARAGLTPGDQIVAINGHKFYYSAALSDALQEGKGRTETLTVIRQNRPLNLEITPTFADLSGEKKWMIGVGFRNQFVVRKLPWRQALASAVTDSARNCRATFDVLTKIVTRQMSTRSLSGPIGIAQVSGKAYRAGFTELLMLMSFISLQLGIFNLLPIPVLDGGMILLLAVETLIRRDLSLAFKERFVQVGIAFLLLLAVFVMYNDILKTIHPS